MKIYGDIERVNLATGERWQRVSGDGESRLVSLSNIRIGGDDCMCHRALPTAEILKRIMEGIKMTVRCKFVCSLKDGKNVSFSPVYSGSEENKQFFAATPGGSLMLYTVNESALAQFEMGKEYYIDITQAE